jgi:7-cyano-7-deazaguanine synthase
MEIKRTNSKSYKGKIKMERKKCIVSMSGGLDSTTLIAFLKENNYNVMGIGFSYGSKHNIYEIESIFKIANFYQIPFKIIDATHIFKGFNSALMMEGGEIPEGHYEAESMKQTVVPGRNMIFSSILAGYAESVEAKEIFLGIHAGDHAIYPDCRPEFLIHMKKAIEAATDNKVTLYAPFINETKADIVCKGICLNAPYALTRTCYKHQKLACGKCGSCQERLEAFSINEMEDPIAYEEN